MTQEPAHAALPQGGLVPAAQPKTEPPQIVPLTDIKVQLSGEDGNAFAVLGRVREALRRGGRRDLIEAFTNEATSGDYNHLLQTCHRYADCS